jgi:hypothetical protein
MNFSHKDALLSDDLMYRYWLFRQWGRSPVEGKPVLWCLLNPSIADARIDDPTVRRAAVFSDEWGFKSMMFVNLYAHRTAYPRELKKVGAPVGPLTDSWIITLATAADRIVVAWGQDPLQDRRAEHVLSLLHAAHQRPLQCFGVNENGHPKHPLYLKNHLPLQEYHG